MPTKMAVRLAERIAEYEERHYGPISPGYAGPSKGAEVDAIARMIDEERFQPLGDNHHNAAECPYCGDPLRAALDKIIMLEHELHELESLRCSLSSSSSTVRLHAC